MLCEHQTRVSVLMDVLCSCHCAVERQRAWDHLSIVEYVPFESLQEEGLIAVRPPTQFSGSHCIVACSGSMPEGKSF